MVNKKYAYITENVYNLIQVRAEFGISVSGFPIGK